MPTVAHMRWIPSQALPWAAVIIIGALLVFGEIGLARFGAWVSMRTDSGTPCGQMLCSCPTSPLAHTLALSPCGQALLAHDLPGGICPLCGIDAAPPIAQGLARGTGGDHPGLLLMICMCPIVLVLGHAGSTRISPAPAGWCVPAHGQRPATRALGVEPHPPKHG